jgi:hypothetical protein
LPARLAGQPLAVRQIERVDHGVDRDLTLGVDTRAIAGHVRGRDAGRHGAVEKNRFDALAAQRFVGERERALDLRDVRAEAAVGELAVDDVETGGQAKRGAIAQRHRQIDFNGACAARRFEAREILAEKAGDQRRVVQECEHLIQAADRVRFQPEVALP